MVITRTPYRVSFFGGGTDYPTWFLQHGGATLACAINKYCYLTARYLPPFFAHRYRIVYSTTELCEQIKEIKHHGVRAVLAEHLPDRGLEIHHDGDLPARSGVGSSSSFIVGLLNAVTALKGETRSNYDTAVEAIRIEQQVLGETVGVQDQIMASFGGLQHIQIPRSGPVSVTPLFPPVERQNMFEQHLMLFYTGLSRTSSQIAGSYVPDLLKKEKALLRYVPMVDEAVQILRDRGRSITDFGLLLDEAWRIKRELSPLVSNFQIDQIYHSGLQAGALGGKLLGAGGGGFLLLFAKPEHQEKIRRSLGQLIEVPISIDSGGSQILFFDRQQDYAREDQRRTGDYSKLFINTSA
jgi:D-glycero-alpha-D-manno-heptose-7-phosphate kinase